MDSLIHSPLDLKEGKSAKVNFQLFFWYLFFTVAQLWKPMVSDVVN